ncbi:nickel pincer cofactor biosynthesis protein LarC [Kineococcus sp. NBC_00420]|uniref:nickel pincer cofactor biosynthesis protein LarC n=1 Tax=Kineococcus sp. NBC_00420 TaxID=2903564 RepID=UPI002E1D0176
MTHAWIDASAGIAGDMLLGALLDAGASLDAVRGAVAAVVGDAVAISTATVTRAGLRATKAEVDLRDEDPPHRSWSSIEAMLAGAGLAARVRDDATAVFALLARAEGHVHGVPAADVHFHEVGALDSIADVVGVCAALHDLGITTVSSGAVALGSGRVRAAHGSIPVPVPAVVELSRGRRVLAGGEGELTTPTGMALLAALGEDEDLPGLRVTGSGTGAGTRDVAGRPNVTRVVVGTRTAAAVPRRRGVQLEANVDDLDPRLWPGVLAGLLATGADDAWLVPVLMKKGRPAHVLTVLAAPERADALEAEVVASTSTLGVRRSDCTRFALPRGWVDVAVEGGSVAVKVGHAGGIVRQVMPEFDTVAALARASGRPERTALTAALAAAADAGWVVGAPPPPGAVLRDAP